MSVVVWELGNNVVEKETKVSIAILIRKDGQLQLTIL
jgi:hypothetical protein